MEHKSTVVIIDDDPTHVTLLTKWLEDAGHRVLCAHEIESAWELLQTHHRDIEAILLDRMMLHLDGLALFERIKGDLRLQAIPVIMQTGVTDKAQIVEGIQAGVFYYLTKPYTKEIVLSLIKSAILTYEKNMGLLQELATHREMLGLIYDCKITFKKLKEAEELTLFLANFYPDPEGVVMGISEMLLNAVEHGNLGITYAEKSKLCSKKEFQLEIARREALPINAHKQVWVHFRRDQRNIVLEIQDEGTGFHWEPYLKMSPERIAHPHGRGIAMAKMLSFDHIEYYDCGNRVVCTKKIMNSPPKNQR